MCDLGQKNATFELLHCLVSHLSRVNRDHWLLKTPYLPKVTKFAYCEVSWGPENGYGIHFHIDLFIVPPDRFRCQSGPLIQLTLGDFSEKVDVSFRNVIRRNYWTEMSYQHAILSRIERRIRWWRFHLAKLYNFWYMVLLNKKSLFHENLTFDLS